MEINNSLIVIFTKSASIANKINFKKSSAVGV